MSEQEQAWFQLCTQMWAWGIELALQRAGFASVLVGGDGEQSAFAPFLTGPLVPDNVTMH